MKILFPAILFFFGCSGIEYSPDRAVSGLRALRARLKQEPDIRKRWQIAGDFYQKRKKAAVPLVEGGRVHFFLWDRDPGCRASVVGPFNRWRVGAQPFRRLAGTPLLHTSISFFPYRPVKYLIAGKSRWYPDTLCRARYRDNAGRVLSLFSPLRLRWPKWAWIPTIPDRGRCRMIQLRSRYFRNTRSVLFYRSPSTVPDKPWELVVLQAKISSGLLPVYRNLFANYSRRFGLTNSIIIVLPVLNPDKELPVRAVDYLDMVKHDLSRELESIGWSPAGAVRRTICMRGRGGGFLLLALFKGVRYFSRLIVSDPQVQKYSSFLRYFSRFRKPGRLSRVALIWAIPGGRPLPQYHYIREGLTRYGLINLQHRSLKQPDTAPDAGVSELERLLGLVFSRG